MASNDRMVVVGDNGLLTWGLGYFLQRAGWQVTVVGSGAGPKEAAHMQGAVDVHPPRVHHHTLIANAIGTVWFGLLQSIMGSQVPPQRIEVPPASILNPHFLHWTARMLPCTREAALVDTDIAFARLLQEQKRIIAEDLAPVLQGKSAPVVSQRVSDLFVDRSAFAEHRHRLVEMEKAKVKFSLSAAKGNSTSSDMFPTLYPIHRFIRGIIQYETAPVYDIPSLTSSLRSYCTAKNVTHVASDVASFTNENGNVASVTLENGDVVPCDAVVLAAGQDTISLLHKAGCYIFPPLFQGTAYAIDVDASKEYSVSSIPDKSVNVQNDLFITRHDTNDRTRLGGLLSFGKSTFLGDPLPTPSYESVSDPAVKEEVTQRYSRQGRLYASLDDKTYDTSASDVWVDAVALTGDGLPLIGQVRKKGRFLKRPSNVFVCSGLGPAGAHAALSSAKLVADLSTDNTPSLDAAPYSLDRFYLC